MHNESDFEYEQFENTNVRPPTDIYEDQLIGGPSTLPGRGLPQVFSNTNVFPGGYSHVSSTTYTNVNPPSANTRSNARNQWAGEYPGMDHYAQQHDQFGEDSYMSNDFDEDAELRRGIASSMQTEQNPLGVQGHAVSQGASVQDTEDEILRQILEQSKNDK